jgi:ferredoxin
MERFLANRWLVSQVYSRLFMVNANKCTTCGLCVKLCPTGNITKNSADRPSWGRNCLLCLSCELKCPQDAITSPISWPIFAPIMAYNISRALRDPALDHAKVTHKHGRTRPV